MANSSRWWQFWRRQPIQDYDDDLPYGASGNQPDPDLWEYGRKSGWW